MEPTIRKDKHWVSITKGATWRMIATCDTILLSYIFTGSIGNSFKIGVTEIFTKIFLFYLHERTWFRIKWGLVKKSLSPVVASEELINFDNREEYWDESRIRSILKGISWRMVGTIDTIIIATLWTGDYTKALKIGVTEVITKIILYYFHERIWVRIRK